MRILVIGYGNSLCGDDGLGPAVAELLNRELVTHRYLAESTTILPLHQLDITLTSELQQYSAVIFIDAQLNTSKSLPMEQRVCITKLMAAQSDQWTGREPMDFSAHFLKPQDLLRLSVQLYGPCPPAWLTSVRAYQMEVGTGLSEQAQENALLAAQEIKRLLQELNR